MLLERRQHLVTLPTHAPHTNLSIGSAGDDLRGARSDRQSGDILVSVVDVGLELAALGIEETDASVAPSADDGLAVVADGDAAAHQARYLQERGKDRKEE